MGQGDFLRRHRVAIASNLAILLAVGAVVAYAVSANGFQSHKTELNDGGIWVTSNKDGLYGRMNKPVNQADGAVFEEPKESLDVAQQGAAVVGIDRTKNVLTSIDPATLKPVEGGDATAPPDADVVLAGGTVAVLDPATGAVRATRVDPAAGRPQLGALGDGAAALAKVGKNAALTVTSSGVVYAVSGDTDLLARLVPRGGTFAKVTPKDAGFDVGEHTTITAVGSRVVLLDRDTGRLVVRGGSSAELPQDSVLQQPGPAAGSVLVAGGGALLEVDLDSGKVTTVGSDRSGRPTEPVRLGACVYGAWSGSRGEVLVRCGSDPVTTLTLDEDATDLVFRVNRGEILLNDRASGAVWNIDEESEQRIDNWQAFTSDTSRSQKKKDDRRKQKGERQPPRAKPDEFGARPGRISVLHPLDNDTAPEGRILAIRKVQNQAGPGRVTIGPDGQSLQVALPADARVATTFEYVVDDGRADLSARAGVTVRVSDLPRNGEPRLRPGFRPRLWTVPAGGTVDVPVLGDWRDPDDSDPVSLADAAAVGGDQSGAVARTTATGRVRFTAPAEGGQVRVDYLVTDNVGSPVKASLSFRVQSPQDTQAVPAVAEPDIVSGVAGEAITVHPLANDLPGSDPLTPDAQLAIEGKLAPVRGATVKTDNVDGTITFTTTTPRTYLVKYGASYGSAKISTGWIRVDVLPAHEADKPPVAMPDQATLFGGAPTLVDVLSNDVDPAGALLSTVRAQAPDGSDLDVAVVQGHWVRIASRQADLTPQARVVRYFISNGTTEPVEGEITVDQRPAVPDNTPVTATDRVTVRAGSGLAVGPLDNDFSPAGDQLSLVSDVADQKAGRLKVDADKGVDGGAAYVAGRLVRYVAPPAVDQVETFDVHYVATNQQGLTAPGRIQVTVVPARRLNQAPEPPTLEGRTVAGSTVKLRLPGAGVDPDGDSVTLTGLGSAPRLGRIVHIGANSIEYQAFPGMGGTDEFTYRVVDSQGATAEGSARISVVPVGLPQPPLAVNDDLTAAPGRPLRADVLANDLVADGDYATVKLLTPVPAGVRLEGPLGPVLVRASARAGQNVKVPYALSNGVSTSQGTLTVHAVKGYNNPPVAFDAFGTGADSDAVEVDVLKAAYDPDGPESGLRITSVSTPPGLPKATIEGPRITLARGEQPMVVPFRIQDADGGAATASVYVPAKGRNAPYVRRSALIRLQPGGRRTVRLSSVIANPSGGAVTLTRPDQVTAAPESIGAAAKGRSSVTLRAPSTPGPGALIVEVSTARSKKDKAGVSAVLSVPVQVGATRPILNCPAEPIEVTAGTSVPVTIASRCHVWTIDPAAAGSLDFQASWQSRGDGLRISSQDGAVVTVAAAQSAARGTRGVLAVTAGGSKPGLIRYVVTGGPPPSMQVVTIDDQPPGKTFEVDLAPYFQPGIANPVPTVIGAKQLTSLDASIRPSGATTVRIALGPKAQGHAEFAVTMSDVPKAQTRPQRQVTGRIVLNVLGAPDAPGRPVASVGKQSGTAQVSWRAPAANGSPIRYYEVQPTGGAHLQRCPSTSCVVSGLHNGTAYSFRVRAVNAVGPSPWSGSSRSITPDALPGQPGPIRKIRVSDHTLKIAWSRPSTDTTVDYYLLVYQGKQVKLTDTVRTVTGLDNNVPVNFKVFAYNHLGHGPARESGPMQSQGPVGAPGAPTISDTPEGSDNATVTVSWPPVPPNGPLPVEYRVVHNGVAVPGCDPVQATSCVLPGVPYNGATHTFTIGAAAQGQAAIYGPSSSWKAVGTPDAFGAWTVQPTGRDREAVVDFAMPNVHSTAATFRVYVDGGVALEKNASASNGHETFQVGDNAGPHNVSLQVCNDAGKCSPVAGPKAVQTYGPLSADQILGATSEVSGTQVRWNITVNNNGNPAYVFVRSGYRSGETLTSAGVGTTTVTTSWVDIGYSNTETVTVELADSDPSRGPGRKDFTSSQTVEAPKPAISIVHGQNCSDDPASGKPACAPSPYGQPCVSPSCAYVNATWANFTGGAGQAHPCVLEQLVEGVWVPTLWRDSVEGPAGTKQLGISVGDAGVQIRLSCPDQATSDLLVW